jgi:hypothetical protein
MHTTIRATDALLHKHECGDIELLEYVQRLVTIRSIDPTDEAVEGGAGAWPNTNTGD